MNSGMENLVMDFLCLVEGSPSVFTCLVALLCAICFGSAQLCICLTLVAWLCAIMSLEKIIKSKNIYRKFT
jgi:hypothetical protein